MRGPDDDRSDTVLPPFCEPQVLFATVVVTELLVAIVALSSTGEALGTWRGFSLASLYAQWIALTAISLLCVTRRWLRGLGYAGGLVAGWFLVLGVTAVGALIAWWLDARFALGLAPRQAGLWHFVWMNVVVAGLVSAAALRYLHVHAEWTRRVRAEAQARVDALQARIRPHFLFNSMNTIASLVRTRPDTAEEAIEDLSDMFRSALAEHRDTTLADEIERVHYYLKMEALRLGDRLTVDWDVAACPGDARLPPLTLQPLVENAVYHGVQPIPAGGCITIRGTQHGKTVTIGVENPLPANAAGARAAGSRMAQDNIAQRMKLYFHGRGKLHIARDDARYRAVLEFPYHNQPRDRDAHADR